MQMKQGSMKTSRKRRENCDCLSCKNILSDNVSYRSVNIQVANVRIQSTTHHSYNIEQRFLKGLIHSGKLLRFYGWAVFVRNSSLLNRTQVVKIFLTGNQNFSSWICHLRSSRTFARQHFLKNSSFVISLLYTGK